MNKTAGQEDLDKALLSALVMMLSTSAMQQLGKLVDPETHKAEANLEAAQVTIDMLEMIRRKTKGNLDSNEERTLNDILSSLQMNYVQVAAATPAKPPAAPDKPVEAPAVDATPKSAADEKSPKYRKSYGP